MMPENKLCCPKWNDDTEELNEQLGKQMSKWEKTFYEDPWEFRVSLAICQARRLGIDFK